MKRGIATLFIFGLLVLGVIASTGIASAGFWDDISDWWTRERIDVQLSPVDCTEGCSVGDINPKKSFSIDGNGYEIERKSFSPSRQEVKFEVRDSAGLKFDTGYLSEGKSIFVTGLTDGFSVTLEDYDNYNPDVVITILGQLGQDGMVSDVPEPSSGSGGGSGNDGTTTVTCTDSDGGIDYKVKGVITGVERNVTGGLVRWDDGSYDYATEEDFCESENLIEYHCGVDKGLNVTQYNCPNGCSEGACLPEAETVNVTCTDSDRVVETREIMEDTDGKTVAGLDIVLKEAVEDGGRNYLSAELIINDKYEVYLNSDYPIEKKRINDIEYEITLVTTSNLAATIRVDNLGRDSYTKGKITSGIFRGENIGLNEDISDICTKDNNYYFREGPSAIVELSCPENNPNVIETIHNCPNGCDDGRCNPIEENEVCLDLIDKVKNPQDFVEDGIEFESSWSHVYEGSTWINGNIESYVEYSAGWNNREDEWKGIDYDVQVYNNKDVDLESYLLNRVQAELCVADKGYFGEDNEQTYYICNWNVLRGQQNVNEVGGVKERQIIWFNDNVLVRVNVYSGKELTDSEIAKIRTERIESFLSSIQDNEKKYISWENYDLERVFNYVLSNDLESCESDVPQPVNADGEECYPSWSCNLEPAICPPHGEQKRVCVDNSCDQKREETVQCSPGICSGCFIPRKGNSESSVCIPYGTRIVFGEGESGRIYLPEIDREMGEIFDLEILDENSAKISVIKDFEEVEGQKAKIIVNEWQEFNIVVGEEFTIYEGGEYNVVTEFQNYKAEFSVAIKEIANPENYEDKYIELEFTEKAPSYCNYDGHIYTQKSKSRWSGDWASCQNNYECESNFCSGGECVEINEAISQAGEFRGLFIKALCRLGNLFDRDGYNQCIGDYLTE